MCILPMQGDPVAWIRTVKKSEIDGELKEIYDDQLKQAGAVANILHIHSLAPHVLSAHLHLYRAAMYSPGDLSRTERELIAVAVSALNGCHY
jgi:uncharacterized peroxidase-related enzyme